MPEDVPLPYMASIGYDRVPPFIKRQYPEPKSYSDYYAKSYLGHFDQYEDRYYTTNLDRVFNHIPPIPNLTISIDILDSILYSDSFCQVLKLIRKRLGGGYEEEVE